MQMTQAMDKDRTIRQDSPGYGYEKVIERQAGWRSLNLKALWAYRELLWVLISRDIKVRYKQTVMGASWALIQPVATMILFSFVFGRLAKIPSDGFPYPVFVYAGLLPWTFFAASLSSSSNSLVGQQQLISKVYFPRLIIPLSSVGACLVDFAIASLVMLVLMMHYGVAVTVNILAIPALVLATVFIALGVGTLLSALTVTYRDFRYVVPFMIQFWMFATPVVYPTSMIPANWQWAWFLNPMAGLIEAFRSAFLGRPFDTGGILLSALSAIAVFVLGIYYFEKMERRFADII